MNKYFVAMLTIVTFAQVIATEELPTTKIDASETVTPVTTIEDATVTTETSVA